VKGGVLGQPGRRDGRLSDVAVVAVTAQQGSPWRAARHVGVIDSDWPAVRDRLQAGLRRMSAA